MGTGHAQSPRRSRPRAPASTGGPGTTAFSGSIQDLRILAAAVPQNCTGCKAAHSHAERCRNLDCDHRAQHKQDIQSGPTSRPRALIALAPVRHPGQRDAGRSADGILSSMTARAAVRCLEDVPRAARHAVSARSGRAGGLAESRAFVTALAFRLGFLAVPSARPAVVDPVKSCASMIASIRGVRPPAQSS